MDVKKIRNDILLIISLILVTAISFITMFHLSRRTNLVAKIHYKDQVVEVIDLSKNEEKDYHIQGLHGELHIHTKNGAIAVIESNCPHQDCVKMGYVDSANHPIICAYNAVYITIDGTTIYDVEI